jgi:hypothetical protein
VTDRTQILLRIRITAIRGALFRATSAGTGLVVSKGGALSTPLGLAVAPNGHILTVNAGDGKIVETTPSGQQVAATFLDKSGSPPGAGALFGLAVAPAGTGVYYVDDVVNTLRLLHRGRWKRCRRHAGSAFYRNLRLPLDPAIGC